jgi:digeranylgeranylglycerophospholipid reductase
LKRDQIHDVAIVGAGPAGCFSAAGLAERGIDVLVLEKERLPKPAPVCTGVIGIGAFDEFDLPRESILSEVRDISLFSPSGKEISYCPESPLAYAVDRRVFDDALRSKAERAGAIFVGEANCRDFRICNEWVEISASGFDSPIRARIVVVASGYSPALMGKLGLERIGDHFEGVQVEASMTDLQRKTEIYVGKSVAPSSFAWVLPIAPDRARIGLTTPRNSSYHLSRFLMTEPLHTRVKSVTDAVRRPIPWGKVKKSFADRILVVGEAAGQVKSTTHGGLYYGLIGAQCAAHTAIEAFDEGDFSRSVLARYEERWRNIIGREIDSGYRLRKYYAKMSDAIVERFFDMSAKDGIMKAVHERARFDWHEEVIGSLFKHPLLKKFFR